MLREGKHYALNFLLVNQSWYNPKKTILARMLELVPLGGEDLRYGFFPSLDREFYSKAREEQNKELQPRHNQFNTALEDLKEKGHIADWTYGDFRPSTLNCLGYKIYF